MKQRTNIVVDRDMTPRAAVAQNPQSLAPHDILSAQRVIEVAYCGFDGLRHEGQLVMHTDVIDDVRTFFVLALKLEFPIQSVIPISDPRYAWDDETSCNANNSSGFNYRAITGNANKLSKHAYGLAFDVNPVQNIYIKYDEQFQIVFKAPADGVYDERVAGTLTHEHPLVQHMKNLGWEWGGDWLPESGRTDYQHFEKSV